MRTFHVDVEGGHKAVVSIAVTGSTFAGSVATDEYGTGKIKGGTVVDGVMKGLVDLKGYEANFEAALSGGSISGRLKYGWFFNKTFTGTETTLSA